MKIAILQSCYLPWKGYFDIIGSVDIFVVYDDVQYRARHWHNRNLIKTAQGPQWITVPVSHPAGSYQPIDEMVITGAAVARHWATISNSYARAPAFPTLREEFADIFARGSEMNSLSELNMLFMQAISRHLGFGTQFVWSRDLAARGRKTDRLVGICRELQATSYLTGPAAADYLEREKFDEAGVALKWMDYGGYAEYPQLHSPFTHQVTILDLLFNVGDKARDFMKAPFAGNGQPPAPSLP